MTFGNELPPNWRLLVYQPSGAGPRYIYRDESFIRSSGLRMQLTPNGDCREASFAAKGSGILIPSLSTVVFQLLVGTTWQPLFAGEVRQGGNARDQSGENYILRSLALRLKEVTLPPDFKTPRQAAHLTVRALIRAVIDSGQLGGYTTIPPLGSPAPSKTYPPLVQYDETLCPDLGFDCRAIVDANQHSPYDFLQQIAEDGAGMGVNVVFGVRPDQKFFCQPARTDTVTYAPEEVKTQWNPPVAETPCTAVLWYVAKKPDGTWLTYLSRSPDADVYGLRVKPLSLAASVNPWTTLTPASGTKGIVGQTPLTLTSGERGYLVDGPTVPPTQRNIPVFTPDTATAAQSLYVEIPAPQPATRLVVWGSSNYGRDIKVYADGTQIGEFPGTGSNLNEFKAVLYTSGTTFRVEAGPPDVTLPDAPISQFQLFELRPERVDTALLDRLARYHFRPPAQEPADIEVGTFRLPSALGGRVAVADYNRAVDAWEYRLSSEQGLRLAALTGQADDPAKLAQADLIKQRDGKAVVTALTAQS